MPGHGLVRGVPEAVESIAAQAEGGPCVTHIGEDGAGHFVRWCITALNMPDMQLIGESYDLLRHDASDSPLGKSVIFLTSGIRAS